MFANILLVLTLPVFIVLSFAGLICSLLDPKELKAMGIEVKK